MRLIIHWIIFVSIILAINYALITSQVDPDSPPRLVFSSSGNIYFVYADGRGLQKFEQTGQVLKVSEDGRFLYFSVAEKPYRINLKHPQAQPERLHPMDDFYYFQYGGASLSPDNQWLSFSAGSPVVHYGYGILSINDQNIYMLMSSHGGHHFRLDWSPDSSQIIFIQNYSLYIANLTNLTEMVPTDLQSLPKLRDIPLPTSVRQLIDGTDIPVHYIEWSPDGHTILATSPSNNTIYTFAPNGDNFRALYVTDEEFEFSIENDSRYVMWSPESTHIALGQENGIFLLDVQTGNAELLSPHTSVHFVGWVDDWIYFSEEDLDAETPSRSKGIFRVSTRHKTEERLTPSELKVDTTIRWWSTKIQFSFDGEWLAFTADASPKSRQSLYIMRTDGSQLQQIVTPKDRVGSVWWMP